MFFQALFGSPKKPCYRTNLTDDRFPESSEDENGFIFGRKNNQVIPRTRNENDYHDELILDRKYQTNKNQRTLNIKKQLSGKRLEKSPKKFQIFSTANSRPTKESFLPQVLMKTHSISKQTIISFEDSSKGIVHSCAVSSNEDFQSLKSNQQVDQNCECKFCRNIIWEKITSKTCKYYKDLINISHKHCSCSCEQCTARNNIAREHKIRAHSNRSFGKIRSEVSEYRDALKKIKLKVKSMEELIHKKTKLKTESEILRLFRTRSFPSMKNEQIEHDTNKMLLCKIFEGMLDIVHTIAKNSNDKPIADEEILGNDVHDFVQCMQKQLYTIKVSNNCIVLKPIYKSVLRCPCCNQIISHKQNRSVLDRCSGDATTMDRELEQGRAIIECSHGQGDCTSNMHVYQNKNMSDKNKKSLESKNFRKCKSKSKHSALLKRQSFEEVASSSNPNVQVMLKETKSNFIIASKKSVSSERDFGDNSSGTNIQGREFYEDSISEISDKTSTYTGVSPSLFTCKNEIWSPKNAEIEKKDSRRLNYTLLKNKLNLKGNISDLGHINRRASKYLRNNQTSKQAVTKIPRPIKIKINKSKLKNLQKEENSKNLKGSLKSEKPFSKQCSNGVLAKRSSPLASILSFSSNKLKSLHNLLTNKPKSRSVIDKRENTFESEEENHVNLVNNENPKSLFSDKKDNFLEAKREMVKKWNIVSKSTLPLPFEAGDQKEIEENIGKDECGILHERYSVRNHLNNIHANTVKLSNRTANRKHSKLMYEKQNAKTSLRENKKQRANIGPDKHTIIRLLKQELNQIKGITSAKNKAIFQSILQQRIDKVNDINILEPQWQNTKYYVSQIKDFNETDRRVLMKVFQDVKKIKLKKNVKFSMDFI